MRLSCPNCDAQYEVAAGAVPPGGRDVQCSNCGHAWFQKPAGAEDATAADPAPPDADDDADDDDGPVVAETHEAGGTADPSGASRRDDLEDDEDEDGADAGGPAPDAPSTPPRRAVDESVLAVLREEAEREVAARRRDAEAASIRTDATAAPVIVSPASDDRSPVGRPVDLDDDPLPGTALARPAKGRELLPDIDAIKSTLQASGDRSGDDALLAPPPGPALRSGGFRAGFLLTVAIGVLLALVYVTAPTLAARVPAAAPSLTAYVAGVDEARLWLDGLARRAGDSLRAQGAD